MEDLFSLDKRRDGKKANTKFRFIIYEVTVGLVHTNKFAMTAYAISFPKKTYKFSSISMQGNNIFLIMTLMHSSYSAISLEKILSGCDEVDTYLIYEQDTAV